MWLWLYIMIILLLLSPTAFCLLNNNNSGIKHVCGEDERQLLLQLKEQLPPAEWIQSEYFKTKYWDETSRDCCLWDGVTCDDSTGHVIGLDLSSSALTGNLHSNTTLFRFTRLRSLNLAHNNFDSSPISCLFGQLHGLTHLDLSESSFAGRIPPEFYHLSNLVSLDLSWNTDLHCDIKTLFGNMTNIRSVSLASINITSEIPTNTPTLLTHLDLSATGLQGELPLTIFEKPSLQVLKLYGNPGLKGSLPKTLNRSNVHSLKVLDLSSTSISGRLPESIDFMNSLNYMRLSNCEFSGPIPESIGNMTRITEIDLSGNELSGQVPSSISNLRQLTRLDLSSNNLRGQLPDAFSNLRKLTSLDFHNNSLVGPIPPSLSGLVKLDISSNALTGPFSVSRAGCGLQKLWYMKLSFNSIQGIIPSWWMLTLPSLRKLSLYFNMMK